METIEIDTYFGDMPTNIEISSPHGTGVAIFHVMINKYYSGELMKTERYGWQIHLHPTTILQGDDVVVIMDLIEEN